jgi:2-keto-4-pentenoate hydratase/2-oxohepta-3-ene-1,7-dioic acid hydratase in catechol pathway
VKLVNFSQDGRTSVGAVTPEGVVDLGRLHADVHDTIALLRAGLLPAAHELVAKRAGAPDHALADVRLLNPAGRGLRYFCIGVNYPERNEEYKDNSASAKYPSLFMRTHGSFSAPGEPVLRPRESEQFDYEGEIVLVIGKPGRRIAQADALEHVFGYSVANEGSVRDWLRHSKFNVTQGKNFDRSGSIGPWIVTADEVGSEPLRVTTKVNGELRQDDSSDRMLFSFSYLIHYLSTFCALESGDVILTGTPSGAGARMEPPRWLRAGDVVEVEVARVGLLRNEVLDD